VIAVDVFAGAGAVVPWWQRSYRADPRAARIADRHYNRQRVGAAQFVPPGRCLERAGFHHAGYTKAGLWAWQLLPEDMPAVLPLGDRLFEGAA